MLVGLFAALFGGTLTLISGTDRADDRGYDGIIAHLVAANPEQGMAMAFTVVMLAGSSRMVFGALKLGHYVTDAPPYGDLGFMTGSGMILIVLQLGPFRPNTAGRRDRYDRGDPGADH